MVMGETTPANQGTPPATVPGQTSEPKVGITSTPTTVTYTQEQLVNHTSDALAEQGRKHLKVIDAITLERNSLREIKDDRDEKKQYIQAVKGS